MNQPELMTNQGWKCAGASQIDMDEISPDSMTVALWLGALKINNNVVQSMMLSSYPPTTLGMFNMAPQIFYHWLNMCRHSQ